MKPAGQVPDTHAPSSIDDEPDLQAALAANTRAKIDARRRMGAMIACPAKAPECGSCGSATLCRRRACGPTRTRPISGICPRIAFAVLDCNDVGPRRRH